MKNLRVAYSRGSGWVSKLIRKVSRSNVNHTLFLVEEQGVEMVIGADWNGMAMQTRARFERKGNVIVDVPPLARIIDDGIPFILGALDTPYDYSGLFGMPLVLVGKFWFKKHWKNLFAERHALFCSEAAATMFRAINYPGAWMLDPSTTDPGTLRDWQYKVAPK
jgi:hypothetical protein